MLSGLTAVLIVSLSVAAAVHFGPWFRIYTALTLAAMIAFAGALSALQSAKLTEGGPTPYLGLYERIGIGAYLLWFAVLAATLARADGPPTR